MNITRNLHALAVLLLLALGTTAFAAQTREKIPDHNFERETVIDDAGLQQWAPWDVPCPQCKAVKEIPCYVCGDTAREHCIICGGDQKSVCIMCTGTARVPDPVVEVACPYCRGIGVYPCAQCWGAGSFPVGQADGSTKVEKCRGCKELGGFDCLPCEGTRLLPAIKIKKKLISEAKLKDVVKLREDLVRALAAFEAFEHEKNGRKTEKAFGKLVKKHSKSLPLLKEMFVLFEEMHKAYSKSAAGYEGYEKKLTKQFFLFEDRTIWLLRHQILLLDKEIARAEFNAAVLAEAK